MKRIIFLFLILLAGCATQKTIAPSASAANTATPQQALLADAYRELGNRNTVKAVKYID